MEDSKPVILLYSNGTCSAVSPVTLGGSHIEIKAGVVDAASPLSCSQRLDVSNSVKGVEIGLELLGQELSCTEKLAVEETACDSICRQVFNDRILVAKTVILIYKALLMFRSIGAVMMTRWRLQKVRCIGHM